MALPLLVSDFKTPKILWCQDDGIVFIKILLIDVKKYYLYVDADRLRFSTNLNGEKYYIIINFFGAVIPEKCKNENTGREIRINIPKGLIGFQWLRLQLESERNPMIVVDPDKIELPHWKKSITRRRIDVDSFQKYKKEHNITNIRPDEPSSGEEESDDERFNDFFD